METRIARKANGAKVALLVAALLLAGAVLAMPRPALALSSSAGYSVPANVYAKVGQTRTVSLKMPTGELANVAWGYTPSDISSIACQYGSYWGKPASITFRCTRAGTSEINVQVNRFGKLTRAEIGTVHLTTKLHISAAGSKISTGSKKTAGSKTPAAPKRGVSVSKGYLSATRAYAELGKFRAANSKKALKKSAKLEKVAKLRAKEIARKYSHTRPNGTSCFTAYPCATVKAENIACGYTTAAAVTDAWAKSPGHRKNMLRSNINSVGIACYRTANGTCYWVQCFAKL